MASYGGVSASFENEYNQRDMPTPEPPRPAPKKVEAPPAPAPVVPVVLPSAEITKAASGKDSRSGSGKISGATAAVEYRGVSSQFQDEHNIADLSLSPKKIPAAPPSKPAPPQQPAAPQPVPAVLPSAELLGNKNNSGKDAKAKPLQPLTNWSGVSSQFQDEHNILAHDSPEHVRAEPQPPPQPEEAKADSTFEYRQPTTTAPAGARSRNASKDYSDAASRSRNSSKDLELPASRSRNASKDYTSAVMQPPRETYAGVAASLSAAADDYNLPPSPVVPRRSKKDSKEVAVEAYPVTAEPEAPSEPEVDEIAAKRDAFVAQAKADAARKSHTTNHYGFSPLSSIHN